jgi:voltage-gated potassium channel
MIPDWPGGGSLMNKARHINTIRDALHEIIFEADTNAGKIFDIFLIISIVISVTVVMLDSVRIFQVKYGRWLNIGEWFFTGLFTVEYLMRLFCVRRPMLYATSFFGVVDLMAVLPTYLSIILPGGQFFLVLRILRVLRIFRVLKLFQYITEVRLLMAALRLSRRKITVFFFVVMTLVIIFGSLMYMIESEEAGFTSIPRSIYWSIVTLTTVGYGDISPRTDLGQAIAAIVMILGYAIIAVPTGIVTVEMSNVFRKKPTNVACPHCGGEDHDSDAKFCKYCGADLSLP